MRATGSSIYSTEPPRIRIVQEPQMPDPQPKLGARTIAANLIIATDRSSTR